MKSNYKKIGTHIKLVDTRNIGLNVSTLLGLSISKEFIPSVANTIGSDMENYKIIRKNQFACNVMQVRRDKKMPVALMRDDNQAIISSAYPVFEIKDTTELLPEYLMMWFSRKEFDREACFYAVGGVRGSLEWNDFCDLKFPIPHPDKQKEIVNEYNIIIKRIELNNKLIQRLEETAQAIYKQWFVDFEFPDENGKPYKSSGGEMVYNDELQKEIPIDWEVKKIRNICKCNSRILSLKDKFETINYLDTRNITKNEIDNIQILNMKTDEIPSRAKRKVNHDDIIYSTVRPDQLHYGIMKNISTNFIVSTGFAVLEKIDSNICSELIYLTITQEDRLKDLQAIAEMSVSTYPSINPNDILNIDFILPTQNILLKANHVFTSCYVYLSNLQKEKKLLKIGSDLLLSRLATINY